MSRGGDPLSAGTVLLTSIAFSAAVVACGSNPVRASTDPRTSADAYIAGIRSEHGSQVCPLLDDNGRRELLEVAANDGPRTLDCVKAGDRAFRGAGRALARVRVIHLALHGAEADATVNDARYSDSGNDMFTLRRAADGRWYVRDI